MSDQPLSARAYASAKRMYDQDPGRMHRPEPEDFAHLDTIQTTTPEETTAPPEPAWDTSAFDALPAELRQPVMAGLGHHLGCSALELAAEGELLRPADVHLHLTDPARYVDGDGRIDRAAIRTDLDRLTRERPELGRYGNGPGQVGARPDERRRGAQGGGGPVVPSTDAVATALARMEAASGVKFARS